MESSSFSELFKMDKCSPLVAYVLIVIVTAICIYNVRSESSKLGDNQKVKNISDMFTWYEVSMLLVTGIILFGLCQYNETTLAWVVLCAPLIAYVVKTVIVFLSASNLHKIIPPDTPPTMPLNQHPANPVAIQQAVNTQVKQQAAIQTPTQQVMPSQKLGYNATPAPSSFNQPLQKSTPISGLSANGPSAVSDNFMLL